jgi:formylglycine-generating enzyme required for sulfatase activity
LTPTAPSPRAAKKKPVALIGIVSSIVLIGLAIIALKFQASRKPIRARIDLPEPVTIAAGSYATPDGTAEARTAFRLAAHEVTIGQYAAFLETLNILTESKRSRTFDSPAQPPEKANHEPTDWTSLFAAAKAGGRWNDQAVTLDSPVVGVDWWDASAFAEWKQARLPSQEEWFAALGKDTLPLEPGPWLPVTSQVSDRTASGLLGMAGSVCEWTSKPAPSPTNPLGDRLWVIIGGSPSKPGSNALTREWTDDRSLRRPDLGFRLAFEVK